MAAVMALVFLFALASVVALLGTVGGGGSVVAALAFTLLASGVVIGLLKMARGWENEA
jgi:hypothetical protein